MPSQDPLCVTSYVREIYQHCRQQEHRAVVGDYMGSQPAINPRMRAILVDWLCSVHHKFKCEPETLYRTVSILDRYLAQRAASRKGFVAAQTKHGLGHDVFGGRRRSRVREQRAA